MKIALLVPSRERISFKRDLANSILNTVSDINNVNLYFGIDDDDPTKEEAIKLTKEFSFIKIIEIHNNGKFEGLGKLWNICANNTKEEIIAMIGDDMVFLTKGWDVKILEEFNKENCPSDNIKMVYCYDGRHGEKIAVNSFIHRKYVDITGYFMREEFKCDFIDLWLQQVFSALGRIKYRKDIHIEHRHWSFGKMPVDNVVRNLRGNNYPAISKKLWIETRDERIREVEKIAKIIGVTVDLNKIDDRIVG
jgi:hypothetical protein